MSLHQPALAGPVRRRLSQAAATAWIPRTCFKHGPPGRVGVELELLVRVAGGSSAPTDGPEYDDWRSAVAGAAVRGRVTIEPGGQLELSSAPCDSLGACLAQVAGDLAVLRAIAADRGLDLVGAGIDDRPVARRVRTEPRYDAMEAYFDRWGPAGRVMMRRTASVQVNLEAATGPGGAADRWELLHGVGPVLLAAFANSPGTAGPWQGWASSRWGAWLALDAARTGEPHRRPGETPELCWARYCLDAPLMLVGREGPDWAAPPGVTFRDWIDGGPDVVPDHPGPTPDDLRRHLTTLFPPVRARGHLEVRYLDALPGDWWQVPVSVLWALSVDPRARRVALAAAVPHRGRWREAARSGLGDDGLARAAVPVIEAALTALRARPDEASAAVAVEAYLDRWTRRRCTPGHDHQEGLPVPPAPPIGAAAPVGAAPSVPHRTVQTRPPGRGGPPMSSDVPATRTRAPGVAVTDVPDLLPVSADALRDEIAARLDRARTRTALLTEAVDDAELVRQHSPLMSPLAWDLAHIGNQEEQWLLRDVGGREPMLPETVDRLYDAFRHARADRPTLPLLEPGESRRYVATVRERVVDVLEQVALEGRPLTERGFVFGMIAQHEQQHGETMLATHQLRAGAPVLTASAPVGADAAADAARRLASLPPEVLVPAGQFTMGTSAEPWALDNERPAHRVDLASFWIDRVPVTNGAYRRFVEDGGYDDPRWWVPDGWAHRVQADLSAPLFWRPEGSTWVRRRFGAEEPVPDDEPVMHVCWYEADAYARWAGRRLPTEAEWEKAARWDPSTGRSLRYPWGDDDPSPRLANLGQRHLQPAPVGAYPAGASPLGVEQLIGDVWEWTASTFGGYPGFVAWPYREYSEVFFGADYRVLRGGAFGVDPVACRGTFRNWDYPIRRQIFAGFRCARDADPDDGPVARSGRPGGR